MTSQAVFYYYLAKIIHHGQLRNRGVFRTALFATLVSVLLTCGGSENPTTEDGNQVMDVGTVIFSEQPLSSTSDAYAVFRFEASNASTYECAEDGGSFTTCTSPHIVIPEQPGSHNVSVRGISVSGVTGPTTSEVWTSTSVFEAGHADLVSTDVTAPATADQSWRGIFRINCDFAHASYNDPVVFPNQENAAHLHMFYGNLLTDHTSTLLSIYSSGDASCQGNQLNRSAYWVPALLAPVYDIQGKRQLDTNGDLAWQVVQAVVGNDEVAHEVFYYSAGVSDLASIQPLPAGLRMIAGSASTNPEVAAQDLSIVRWHCQSWDSDNTTNPQFSTSIPECTEPDRVRFDIFFPSCWDGVNLDFSDHKSHMAYPIVQDRGASTSVTCPSSHPVPVARVSYHYAFGVFPTNSDPITKSSKGWRLASDMFDVSATQAGGLSLHGDWFNGWHPEVMQKLVENCIRAGLDCHDGNLANGKRLSGTQAGSKSIPEVINEGLGTSQHH